MHCRAISHCLCKLAIGCVVAIQVPLALAQIKAGSTNKTEAAQRLIFAVNEGASGNVDAAEIARRYNDLKEVIERSTRTSLTLVAVRDANALRKGLQAGTYALVLSRPVDILAVAVRDYKYQPVVRAKEDGHAYFIVPKDSPIKLFADIKGKRMVTPEEKSYMWHITNAVLRDNKFTAADIERKVMRDQAAIGWSVNGGFFDVGVVASFSGTGRNWEKEGGRILSKSRAVPVTPLIASPAFSAEQVTHIRKVLVALESTETGKAILKSIGISGFRGAEASSFVELLDWLRIEQ